MRRRHLYGRVIALAAIAAIASTVGAVVASGGTTAGTKPTASSASGKRVCIAMKTQLQPRWKYDFQAMSAKLKALGDTVVGPLWANDDPAKQASQVESLLTQGCDSMILIPVDDKAAASLVSEAKAQNVPVVSYDILIQSPDVAFFVERNNTLAGVLQGRAAVKFTGGKGNIALIKGDAANSVARLMGAGELKVLKKYSGFKIVFNQYTKNWDPNTALSESENILSRYNDNIAAIVTMNDGMATGAAQALKERNLVGKVFVSGLDGDLANLKLIAQGLQTMTVYTPVDAEGRDAAVAANALARGQHPKPMGYVKSQGKKIPTDFIKVLDVNKSNLCNFLKHVAPKGWASVKAVYGTSTCK
jgi:D-xylose transport system substrate-binding protein